MTLPIEWLHMPKSTPRFKLTDEEWTSALSMFVDDYQIEQHYVHPDGYHDMQIMPAWIENLKTTQTLDISSDVLDELEHSWKFHLQAYLDTVEHQGVAVSDKPLYWDQVPHLVKSQWVDAAVDFCREDGMYHFNCDSSSKQYRLIDWNLELGYCKLLPKDDGPVLSLEDIEGYYFLCNPHVLVLLLE